MADTKWADVAHYYQKSGVILQRNRRPELVCKFLYAKGFLLYGISETIGDIIWPFDECTPILRHLEDMTEAEAREIYRLVWGFDLDISVSMWDSGIDYFESLYGRYISAVFIWLIFRGFDLFGLIESGQAIRKEAGNG